MDSSHSKEGVHSNILLINYFLLFLLMNNPAAIKLKPNNDETIAPPQPFDESFPEEIATYLAYKVMLDGLL